MSDNDTILDLAAGLRKKNEPFAMATVVRAEGATSAKAGAKAVVRADGAIEGWVGGGCTQPAVRKAVRSALADGKARLIHIRPEESQGEDGNDGGAGADVVRMTCPSGGSLDVFIEPILPSPALYVLGASRAGQVLAGLARQVGFAVTAAVLEGDAGGFEGAAQVIEGFDLGEAARQRPGFIVVATQGKGDREALEAALDAGAGYIAFITSRRKAMTLKQDLVARGREPAQVEAIRAPAGLDIGAATPEEVAVSVLAEIVQERRRGFAAAEADEKQEPGVTTEVVAPAASGCCGAGADRD